MSEEKMAILNMVAEKKITAEEGVALLESLGTKVPPQPANESESTGRTHHRVRRAAREGERAIRERERQARRDERHRNRQDRQKSRQRREQSRTERQVHWQDKLDDLSRMIEGVFGKDGFFGGHGAFSKEGGFGDMGFKGPNEPETQPFDIIEFSPEQGAFLTIENANGDIIIRGKDSDKIRLLVPAGIDHETDAPQAHYDQDANHLQIRSADQNLVLELPWQVSTATIKHQEGNLLIRDLSMDLDLTLNDSNLSLRDITGALHTTAGDSNLSFKNLESTDFDLKFSDGAATVALGLLTEGSVKCVCNDGSLALSLPRLSAFDLSGTISDGRITTNLNEDITESDGTIALTHNGGGAEILLIGSDGNIDVRLVDPAVTETISENMEEESTNE
jgi:hypothetical protein